MPVDERWLLRAGSSVVELANDLREFLAANLFESGRLTLGQAAEVGGGWQYGSSWSPSPV